MRHTPSLACSEVATLPAEQQGPPHVGPARGGDTQRHTSAGERSSSRCDIEDGLAPDIAKEALPQGGRLTLLPEERHAQGSVHDRVLGRRRVAPVDLAILLLV